MVQKHRLGIVQSVDLLNMMQLMNILAWLQVNVQNHRSANLLNLHPIDIRRLIQTRYLLLKKKNSFFFVVLDRYDLK